MAKATAIFNMATQVDIVNLALSALGSGATVKSINPTDGSPEALQAAKWYPMAVRRVVEDHEWSFLTTTEEPAQYEGDFSETRGYRFAFALPSDMARVISVGARGRVEKEVEYKMELLEGTETWALFTNEEFPVVKYIRQAETPTLFPAYFIEPLVMLLASYLVGPLKRSDFNSQTIQGFLKQYQLAMQRARQIDIQSTVHKKAPKLIPSHLRARMV